MKLDKFWHVVPDKEMLEDLEMEQAQAIFRLLILSSFADDHVSDEERVTLAQAVTRLPFFRPGEWHVFEELRGIQILANLHDRYKREPAVVLSEIRDHLRDEPIRVLALRLVALFMQPDGYGDDEHAFCMTIGEAFGLDAELVNVVIEDVVDWAEAP